MKARSRTWVIAGVLVAGTAGTIAACQTPTSMTIEVSTDVDCSQLPGEHLAHIVAGTPDGVVELLDASSTKQCTESGNVGEVVLLPKEDENAAVAVKVILGVDRPTGECGLTIPPDATGTTPEEQLWSGCIVSRRRLSFVEGEALVVEVPLNVDCIGVPCSEAAFTTCVAGGRCVPADIDPNACLGSGCGEDDLPDDVASAAASTSASSGDGGASPSGSSGGGEGGAGGGGPCVDPSTDCDAPDECMRATCDDGACAMVPADLLDPCATGFCDGEGLCVACVTELQCTPGECETATCEGGVCEYANATGSCSTGTCENGECVTPLHCRNNLLDGQYGETGVDCGGECEGCDVGVACGDGDDCATGFCMPDTHRCAVCDSEADCGPGRHCAGVGICEDDGEPGEPCGGPNECESGFCVDGVCCQTACDDDDACTYCPLGTCIPRGEGESSEGGCDENICTFGCDGEGECDYAADTTVCDRECAAGTATTAYCDGEGLCGPPVNNDPCYPFLCSGDACGDDCSDPGDCVSGAECTQGVCEVQCNGPSDCDGSLPVCRVADCQNSQCVAVPGDDGAVCSEQECSPDGGSMLLAGVCDDGDCDIASVYCLGFVCRAGACLGMCDSDDDCFGGRTCNGGDCTFGGSSTSSSSSAATTSAVSSSASAASSAATTSAISSIASSGTTGFAPWADGGAPPW